MGGERGWSDKRKALATARSRCAGARGGQNVRGAPAGATSNRLNLPSRRQIKSGALLILIHWQQLLLLSMTVKALFFNAFQLILIICLAYIDKKIKP
jgi:hypothetical protein